MLAPAPVVGEPHVVAAYAEELTVLSTEHGFPQWMARARLQGWLLVRQRQGAGGIAQIQQGIGLAGYGSRDRTRQSSRVSG